jgi:hypothetical protein
MYLRLPLLPDDVPEVNAFAPNGDIRDGPGTRTAFLAPAEAEAIAVKLTGQLPEVSQVNVYDPEGRRVKEISITGQRDTGNVQTVRLEIPAGQRGKVWTLAKSPGHVTVRLSAPGLQPFYATSTEKFFVPERLLTPP